MKGEPMKTIFKYPLKVEDSQMVEMPQGAVVLTVQSQRGIPCVWAEVDPSAPIIRRSFVTYGTGHPAENGFPTSYVGTYQLHEGSLVFHVYTDRVEYPKDA